MRLASTASRPTPDERHASPAGSPGARASVLRLAGVAAALLAAASAARAQSSWSDEYDRPGLLGRVFALGHYQGDLVAGGTGIQADGVESLGLCARFDGTHWRPMGAGLSSGGDKQVRAFTEYQGELVVGGRFCCSGGQSISSIARWNGTQWSSLGSGVPGIVYELAVFQGDLYACGQFESAGGVPVKNIARWDGAQWHDVGGGLDKSFDPEILAMAVGPDDRLYVGGEFDTAGGAPASNVAVWDGSAWSPLGSGLPGALNGFVHDLVFYQGQLHAGSNFDLIPGGTNHDKVARWDGSQWSSVGVFEPSAIASSVFTLTAIGPDLYAGGSFVHADGLSVDRFARYDGTQWTFEGGVFGSSTATTVIDSIEHQGRIVVGGEFSQAGMTFWPGQAIVAESVAAYDGTTWESIGTGLGFNFAPDDAVLWNGNPVVVGNFWEAGAGVVAGPVMLQNGRWEWLGHFSGHVDTAIVFEEDLVVAGDFTQVDSLPFAGVARFDGTQWTGFGDGGGGGNALAVYQGQLYVGGLGGVKRWNGTDWETFAPQLFGQVYDLHVHQGVLYVGGSMFGSGNIASWDGTTQQTVGGGTSGSVYTLESFEGDLMVGGVFSSAGGVPVDQLARWDGIGFSAFPGLSGTNVDSLAVFQGALHASGNLIVPGLPPNKYIARWDGGAWVALGGGLDGPAAAMVPDEASGKLYTVGLFNSAGDTPSWYFAEWRTTPVGVGAPFCFGDGTGTACPCGNSGSTGHGCANGTFTQGAELTASGLASLSNDSLSLSVIRATLSQPGLFFQGDNPLAGGAGSPFGDGLRCAGGGVVRLDVVQASPLGNATSTVPLGAAGGVLAGDTKHFQWWYRDPQLSLCGNGFNLSNGLSITWTP